MTHSDRNFLVGIPLTTAIEGEKKKKKKRKKKKKLIQLRSGKHKPKRV